MAVQALNQNNICCKVAIRNKLHNKCLKNIWQNKKIHLLSGSGKIDKNEFRDWISVNGNKYLEGDLETQMKAAFAIFDVDNSGTISRSELERIMKHIGDEPLSEEEWNNFITDIDTDGDEQINYEGKLIKLYIVYMILESEIRKHIE